MQEILFGYKLNPTTWAYISSLMVIGVYFKFQRFWSVRNLDLVGLIAFSPGLLLVYHGLLKQGPELVRAGYIWLFAVGLFFLIRLLLDPMMVRRPLLAPNLSAGGLAFTGAAMLVFLMANVVTCPHERLEFLLAQQDAAPIPTPCYAPFMTFSNVANEEMVVAAESVPSESRNLSLHVTTTHAVAILAHLAVVFGMVWIGFRHFDNLHTGVAAATLYLLAFYTSQLTSHVEHVAPAALLVWAVAVYRLPSLAGVLIGLAGGLIFYPLFLLPLWCGFYWRRGAVRFLLGAAAALAMMVIVLAFCSNNFGSFTTQLGGMFGIRNPFTAPLSGFWQYFESVYRIPVAAAFVALCVGLAIWPAHKNLGTLISCSAAVMLATQFWHANQGGLCMAWFLPLLILTIFRPNLEDRVALSAVSPMTGRRRTGS